MRMSTKKSIYTLALSFLALVISAHAQDSSSPPVQEPPGELTLGHALALALQSNPGLAAFAWDIRAAEAREIQAGLRPNPELSLELEDLRVGGAANASSTSRAVGFSPADGLSIGAGRASNSAHNGAFGDTQLTLAFSQLVELGGKRAKRVEAAKRERDVVTWDYEVARADVLAQTARAFYTVLAAQEHARLSETLAGLARQAHETTKTLVQAGKVSAIEESRSQVELSQLAIELETAASELRAARIELAGNWGSSAPQFNVAIGNFPDTFAPPPADDLKAALDQSPYLTRWIAELEQRDALVDLARANGKPDLTVTFGVRSTGTSGVSSRDWGLSSADGLTLGRSGTDSVRDTSVVLGFSLPLPLFNRNQGSIKEAEYLANKAADERRAVEAGITNVLTAGYERATATHAATQTLKNTVIPTAQEAFDAVQEGYRAGKFGLLDVLLAQRALFDAQRQLTRSQASFQQTLVEIERFTGMAVEPSQSTQATTSVEEKK